MNMEEDKLIWQIAEVSLSWQYSRARGGFARLFPIKGKPYCIQHKRKMSINNYINYT